MPKYIGITCERSRKEKKPYMTREECDKCVQSPDHPCPFHGSMLRMMWGDGDKEPGALTFSPTRVQGCHRRMFYEKEGTTGKILDPRRAWHALRGSMSHAWLEHAPDAPGVMYSIREERMNTAIETKHGEKVFVGKPDMVEVLSDDGKTIRLKITDWKSTKEIKHDFLEAKEAHQIQVNMYAVLCFDYLSINRPDVEIVISEYEIVYFTMDKPRRFTSAADITDRGKQVGKRSEHNYEQLELARVKKNTVEHMRRFIAQCIEDAITAQEVRQPRPESFTPFSGLCPYCPFRDRCWSDPD